MTAHKALPLFVLLVALLARHAAGAEDYALAIPNPLPLQWCQERATAANPRLAADEAASQAAQHRIAPAGSLDDPRFRYELVNVPRDEFDLDSTPMSGQQLGLAQKFPFPGLLGNRRRAASAAADAAHQQLVDRRRRVASAVERAWTELGFAQRALAITDRNLDLLRQFTKIAEAKYRVGLGLQQDVLRAHVELTVLLDERLRRVAAVHQAEAALATLLDLPASSSFPGTAELRESAPMPDLEQVLTRITETSPLLRARTASIEEAERRYRVAELEGYPDFDLGIGYRIRQRTMNDPVSGEDFLAAGVTIRLPLNRAKWRERVAERGALLRRAKAHYRDAHAALRNAIRSRFADLERASAEVDLIERGLLPQARKSLESSQSGYQVDKVDFLSLINSQVRLLGADLRLVRAIADRRIAFAEVEAAFGEGIR